MPGAASQYPLDGRLIGKEVTAVNGVVEVDRRRVALALGVDGAVDAALRADRVRALHRHNRKQIDLLALLGQLHCGHQTREAAANDDVISVHRLNSPRRRSPRTGAKRENQRHHRHHREREEQRDTGAIDHGLCARSHRQSPGDAEGENSVRQMIQARNRPYDVRDEEDQRDSS